MTDNWRCFVLENNKSSNKKQFGFILGVSALVCKAICFLFYPGSIFEWWGRLVILYFASYLTSVLTITSSVSENKKSKILSSILLILSICFLGVDYYICFGYAVSLSNIPLNEIGIMPFVNLMNVISNVVILLEAKAFNKPISILIAKIKKIHKVLHTSRLFRKVNVFEIICIIIFSLIFLYINNEKLSVNGMNTNEFKVMTASVRYLENTYSEDFRMNSTDGSKGEVCRCVDYIRPGCNTYCVQLFWKNVPVTAYVELKPDGSLDVYKENFQYKKYSFEMNEICNFECDFLFDEFVIGKPVLYSDYKDYLTDISDRTWVDIEIRMPDEIIRSDIKRLEKLVNTFPDSMEGSLIIQFYYTNNDQIINLSSVYIPYAHQRIDFSRMATEKDYIPSHGMVSMLSMNYEYVYDEILDSVERVFFNPDYEENTPDISDFIIGKNINEYMIEGTKDTVYFTCIGEFYPLLYKNEVVSNYRLHEFTLYDWYYQDIIEMPLCDYLTAYSSGPIAVLYDAEYAYIYNGEDIICIGRYCIGDHERLLDSNYRLVDSDPSTEIVEFDSKIKSIEFDDIELTYIN